MDIEIRTKADAIRYALLIVENPEMASADRVVAVAQARLEQVGLKGTVNSGDVSQVRTDLHRIYKKPITKQIVEHRCKAVAANVAKITRYPIENVAKATTIEIVTAAQEYVKSCGGIEAAIKLLEVFQEVKIKPENS